MNILGGNMGLWTVENMMFCGFVNGFSHIGISVGGLAVFPYNYFSNYFFYKKIFPCAFYMVFPLNPPPFIVYLYNLLILLRIYKIYNQRLYNKGILEKPLITALYI
jgi:hypothetical protein